MCGLLQLPRVTHFPTTTTQSYKVASQSLCDDLLPARSNVVPWRTSVPPLTYRCRLSLLWPFLLDFLFFFSFFQFVQLGHVSFSRWLLFNKKRFIIVFLRIRESYVRVLENTDEPVFERTREYDHIYSPISIIFSQWI